MLTLLAYGVSLRSRSGARREDLTAVGCVRGEAELACGEAGGAEDPDAVGVGAAGCEPAAGSLPQPANGNPHAVSTAIVRITTISNLRRSRV